MNDSNMPNTEKIDVELDGVTVEVREEAGTTDHSLLSNRDAADQHPISAITGLERQLSEKQPAGDYLTRDELPSAIDSALEQASASGEFDGEPGKSAYQSALDGGYVGTESEFNADLARTGDLPAATAADNGKFLRVVDGAWAAVTIPNAEEASF